MFTCFVVILTLSLGISIVTAYYPLSLGLWVLVLSISISILISTRFSSWFGFIIFLIYIGGILVMFAYFVAIQPNQQFNLKTPFFFTVLCIFNLPINIYPVTLNLIVDSNWWIRSLFFIDNVMIIVLLGVVLFLALVIVVKITTFSISSLRPFN